ncbi:TPA: transposase [Vibrio vulnificus]
MSRARLPEETPQGIMGPNLLSYTAVLAGQYHLSVRKIQFLLKEQLGTTFSVGAISEAQTKVASMLIPLHQAVRDGIQKAPWYISMRLLIRETMNPACVGVGWRPVTTWFTRKSCTHVQVTQRRLSWAMNISV